ncbi:MAG TPA: rhodanese-like domain-containing protein [Candidatus Nanoarchaeia archaeon]|nr:rhodanese-like domain-containing protein [Candidatus Nanoarchaeia archaeon]
MTMQTKNILILAILLGALAGGISAIVISKLDLKTDEDRIAEFYKIENAVHVSPHSLRKSMDKGATNFILVDLRSAQEYEKEHIIGAINIPAYSDPNTSAYGDVERIVGEFAKLPKDKDIIVYCYSIPCMTGRKIGKMLVEHGIYVKHLGIGWNEWRYYWNLWNHELEWNSTRVTSYISSGLEPGVPTGTVAGTACPIGGEFGC